MIILKEMARFNEDVKLSLTPDHKSPNKLPFDVVRIYGLYNTNIQNYIDIAFANVVNSDTCDCAVWMINKGTAFHIATTFDLSKLQETITLDTTVVPYKGTKLAGIAEILWSVSYPIYLSIEYSPIKVDSNYKIVSCIDNAIRNAKVKDISQEDIAELDSRFLAGVSYTEGSYVKKDNLIITYLKVDFDNLIYGEQLLLLPDELKRFCGGICRHVGTDVTAISEYGFKINYKNSYFVVNQYSSSCDKEHVYFEIHYGKRPNTFEVVSNHDSPNDIRDAISRLVDGKDH